MPQPPERIEHCGAITEPRHETDVFGVMEKAGMQREGTLRSWAVCGETAEPVDCDVFAVVQ